jgi:nucleolar complex protein 2
MKRLLMAFSSGCHISDVGDDNEGKNQKGTQRKYHIPSIKVYNALMVTVLKRAGAEFHYHLVGEGSGLSKDDGKKDSDSEDETPAATSTEISNLLASKLKKSPKYKTATPLIYTFFKSTLHLLNNSPSASLLTFTLKSLTSSIPFLSCFDPRLSKLLLKGFIKHWSNIQTESEDDNELRLQSFLRIRQMSMDLPFPFIEEALKATYISYTKSSKFVNEQTLPTITFLGNCVVELYSLDLASSYQHAFIYIRQLSLHLRSALVKMSKESFSAIYNWQFFNSLRLWTAVISNNPHELSDLLYPLVEIIMGVIRLVPTARHLPIRLHCVRLLQQLASCSERFIPTSSVLLDVLGSKEFSKGGRKEGKNKKATKKENMLRLPLVLKLPKEDTLATELTKDIIMLEVFTLLEREVDLYRYTAGFPEFSCRITARLRKFVKDQLNPKWRSFAKGCIEACERNSTFVEKGRLELEGGPKGVKRLEVLKPKNVLSMKERLESVTSKEKRLEDLPKPKVSAKEEKKQQEERARGLKQQEKLGKKEMAKEAREEKVRAEKRKNATLAEDFDEDVDVDMLGGDEVGEGLDWSDDDDEEEVDAMEGSDDESE